MKFSLFKNESLRSPWQVKSYIMMLYKTRVVHKYSIYCLTSLKIQLTSLVPPGKLSHYATKPEILTKQVDFPWERNLPSLWGSGVIDSSIRSGLFEAETILLGCFSQLLWHWLAGTLTCSRSEWPILALVVLANGWWKYPIST